MSNLIPFESKTLPAHIKAAAIAANNDLSQGVSQGGFPFLSIKGKIFTLVKDGNRTVITKPDDPDEAASSLEIVVIKANPNFSKVFYRAGYQDGADAKPDCFSNDGKKPDASVEKPLCSNCAECPKNAWGSSSNGKGKACSDSRRLAVAPAGQLNDPMLLRVPPASLKGLAEFADTCNKRGAIYSNVVVKLKFEREEPTPKLVFSPIAFLDAAGCAEVAEVAASDAVAHILGTPVQPKEEKPATKALPKKEAAPAEEDADEAPPAPAPKPAAKKEAAKPAPAPAPEPDDEGGDDLLGELDAMLGGSDD